MQLITPDQGWALVGNRLLWSEDGGSSWSDITPPADQDLPFLCAFFLDSRQGWILRAVDDSRFVLLLSKDGGRTWPISSQVELPPEIEDFGQVLSFSFVNPRSGWISLQLPSGSSFSQGVVLSTQDGGIHWTALQAPAAGPVRFVNGLEGWLAGGVRGDEIYQTLDGGRSWQVQSLPFPAGVYPGSVGVSLPWLYGSAQALVAVTFNDSSGSHLAFYTSEKGQSWSLLKNLPVPEEQAAALLAMDRGTRLPVVLDGNAGPGALLESRIATSILDLMNQLPGVVQLEYASPQIAWARLENGTCSGDKVGPGNALPAGGFPFTCWLQSSLLKTMDGGQTWLEITP